MTKPISRDLWQRVKTAYLSGGESYASLSKKFGISVRAIEKIGAKDGWYRLKSRTAAHPSQKSRIGIRSKGICKRRRGGFLKLRGFDERVFCNYIEEQIDDVVVNQLALPPIQNFEREYKTSRGRVDFVVWHEDGSTSLIEVKYDGKDNLRQVATALGQLLLYFESYKKSEQYRGEVVRLVFVFNKDLAKYQSVIKQIRANILFLRPKLYL